MNAAYGRFAFGRGLERKRRLTRWQFQCYCTRSIAGQQEIQSVPPVAVGFGAGGRRQEERGRRSRAGQQWRRMCEIVHIAVVERERELQRRLPCLARRDLGQRHQCAHCAEPLELRSESGR